MGRNDECIAFLPVGVDVIDSAVATSLDNVDGCRFGFHTNGCHSHRFILIDPTNLNILTKSVNPQKI